MKRREEEIRRGEIVFDEETRRKFGPGASTSTFNFTSGIPIPPITMTGQRDRFLKAHWGLTITFVLNRQLCLHSKADPEIAGHLCHPPHSSGLPQRRP